MFNLSQFGRHAIFSISVNAVSLGLCVLSEWSSTDRVSLGRVQPAPPNPAPHTRRRRHQIDGDLRLQVQLTESPVKRAQSREQSGQPLIDSNLQFACGYHFLVFVFSRQWHRLEVGDGRVPATCRLFDTKVAAFRLKVCWQKPFLLARRPTPRCSCQTTDIQNASQIVFLVD